MAARSVAGRLRLHGKALGAWTALPSDVGRALASSAKAVPLCVDQLIAWVEHRVTPPLQTCRLGKTAAHRGSHKHFCVSCSSGQESLKDSKRRRVSCGLAGRRCPGGSTPPVEEGSEAATVQTPGVCLWLFSIVRVQYTFAQLGCLRGRTSASGIPSRWRHDPRPTKALVALQQMKFNCHGITRENLALGRLRCS